jgi:hypothetical protein
MTELVDMRIDADRLIVTFREDGRVFEVPLSVQAAATLVASLSSALVDLAPANPPGIPWLRWPQLARSADVSFDIEMTAPDIVGIAVKLPGLLPLTVEIPPAAAREVAGAIHKAAEDAERARNDLKS